MKTFTKSIITATLALFGFGNITNSKTLFNEYGNEIEMHTIEPKRLMIINGTMYFLTKEKNTNVNHLWKSDGTPEGTTVIDNIIPQSSNERITLLEMKSCLYYIVDSYNSQNSTNCATLWKSNAPDTGASLIDSLVTKSVYSNNGLTQAGNYFVVRNKLFLQMRVGNLSELWVSDGTAGGLHQVFD